MRAKGLSRLQHRRQCQPRPSGAGRARAFTALVALLGSTTAACGSTKADDDSNPCIEPSGRISNFDTGIEVNDGGTLQGGAFAYPDGVALNVRDGVARVTGLVYDYAGVGFWFGSCINAAKYEGLVFDIGSALGPFPGVRLVIGTRENNPAPPVTDYGTCKPSDPNEPFADCLPAFTELSIGSDLETKRVPFETLSDGVPHRRVNPSQITDITFWFPWTSGSTRYEVDLTLDNVAFYE